MADGLAGWEEFLRLSMDVCPSCGTEMGPATCCMTYSTWHCWGCGANLDGRVVTPKSVKRCVNEWPDYKRTFGDPVHPLACSCIGRGWYPWADETGPSATREVRDPETSRLGPDSAAGS